MRSITAPRPCSRAVAALCAVLLLALVILPSAAEAQSATRKFGRGLAAMTTGFLEIPGNMVTESKSNGWGYGLTLGFVKGLGAVVVREIVGVYEFLSAPFPVPQGYRPLIQPEFPWDHFD